MPVGEHIEQNTKDDILQEIRDDGMKVTDVAEQYGISSKTIYAWLRAGVVDGNRNLILVNNRLKKDLEIAYRVLGRATTEMQRSKD